MFLLRSVATLQQFIPNVDWTTVVLHFVNQSPGVVGVLVVSFLFLKAQRQRDNEYLRAIRQLTQQIDKIGGRFIKHDSWERNMYAAIVAEHAKRSVRGKRK